MSVTTQSHSQHLLERHVLLYSCVAHVKDRLPHAHRLLHNGRQSLQSCAAPELVEQLVRRHDVAVKVKDCCIKLLPMREHAETKLKEINFLFPTVSMEPSLCWRRPYDQMAGAHPVTNTLVAV